MISMAILILLPSESSEYYRRTSKPAVKPFSPLPESMIQRTSGSTERALNILPRLIHILQDKVMDASAPVLSWAQLGAVVNVRKCLRLVECIELLRSINLYMRDMLLGKCDTKKLEGMVLCHDVVCSVALSRNVQDDGLCNRRIK